MTMTVRDAPQLTTWLAEAGRGDVQAQEALFRAYSPAVFRLCLGLLGDADDAEEVLQDSFVYALRNVQRFDPAKSAFQTWMFTIAISRCRNKRRRKWLPQLPLGEAHEVRSEGGGQRPVEAALAARGVRRDLWSALGQLPYAQREVLVLRFFAGMAYAEIGALVDCNPKTAESRARLGIKGLRGLLDAAVLESDLIWDTAT